MSETLDASGETPVDQAGIPAADELVVTHGKVGVEVVNEAPEVEEQWDVIGSLIESAEQLWIGSLTRSGEQDVLAPSNLFDIEYVVTPRVTKKREIATFVEMGVKIGRTTHQHTYRIYDDKGPELAAFLNDRMSSDVASGKWTPEEVLNLMSEIGELVDITIHGKVPRQKNG
tara:strand:- start:148 stop:663 length:516 start_codon:yes stop_codon:yes gene_type:complete